MKENLRQLMRRVPQSVVIVTSTNNSLDSTSLEKRSRGVTVSSFTVVSLDQKRPVISFNLKRSSSVFEAIKSSGSFHIHFPNQSKEAARLANDFASGKGCCEMTGPGDVPILRPINEPGQWKIRQYPFVGNENESPIYGFVLCKWLPASTQFFGSQVVIYGGVRTSFHPQHLDSQLHGLGYLEGQYLDVKEDSPSGVHQRDTSDTVSHRIPFGMHFEWTPQTATKGKPEKNLWQEPPEPKDQGSKQQEKKETNITNVKQPQRKPGEHQLRRAQRKLYNMLKERSGEKLNEESRHLTLPGPSIPRRPVNIPPIVSKAVKESKQDDPNSLLSTLTDHAEQSAPPPTAVDRGITVSLDCCNSIRPIHDSASVGSLETAEWGLLGERSGVEEPEPRDTRHNGHRDSGMTMRPSDTPERSKESSVLSIRTLQQPAKHTIEPGQTIQSSHKAGNGFRATLRSFIGLKSQDAIKLSKILARARQTDEQLFTPPAGDRQRQEQGPASGQGAHTSPANEQPLPTSLSPSPPLPATVDGHHLYQLLHDVVEQWNLKKTDRPRRTLNIVKDFVRSRGSGSSSENKTSRSSLEEAKQRDQQVDEATDLELKALLERLAEEAKRKTRSEV